MTKQSAVVKGVLKSGASFGPFTFTQFSEQEKGSLRFVNEATNSVLLVRDADIQVLEVISGMDLLVLAEEE